jgi:hypothetical protein
MSAKQQTTFVGVFDRVKWRASDDSNRIIGLCECGTAIIGVAEEGDLVPGLTYEFYGVASEHESYGRQFKFNLFTQKEPHSRHGIIAYLQKYAPNIGPAIAIRLWDAFAGDAVKVLRTQPELAIKAPNVGKFLTLEKAQEASAVLRRIAELEDTKIELTNLFNGRGFPGSLVEECIDKWRILAPARIRRDPFCLLVEGFSGCGFARCDRLYVDLGLPPERLKRQMICLWHVLHEDSSGHTWIPADVAVNRLGQLVSGAALKTKKAILLGCRSGWLARKRDSEGRLWLAEGKRAEAEQFVAEKLIELSEWEPLAAPAAGLGELMEVVA